MKRKILIGLLVIFILIQFIPTDRSVPDFDKKQDFIAQSSDEWIGEETRLIEIACYDCHSYETQHPWYSKIMPVSKWLQGHIENGRKKVNFSTWADLSTEDQKFALKECAEVLEETRMPLLPYMMMHKEAWITEEERASMVSYFNKRRKAL